jgi:hypothetical protein
MIGLEDRQALARDIHTAHTAGARVKPACAIVGIDLRTLERQQARLYPVPECLSVPCHLSSLSPPKFKTLSGRQIF